MSVKLKPSTKLYKRDSKGKIVGKKYTWQHHTPSSLKTEELKSMFEQDVHKRKKHLIKIELEKRGIAI